jgi:hypothetical protein
MLGTFGIASERIVLATPSPLTLPVRMNSIVEGSEANEISTWPPSKAVSAGLLPAKGTFCRLTPAAD